MWSQALPAEQHLIRTASRWNWNLSKLASIWIKHRGQTVVSRSVSMTSIEGLRQEDEIVEELLASSASPPLDEELHRERQCWLWRVRLVLPLEPQGRQQTNTNPRAVSKIKAAPTDTLRISIRPGVSAESSFVVTPQSGFSSSNPDGQLW